MRTLEKPATVDYDLLRRAERKLRRHRIDLNRVLSVIVNVRGLPDFISTDEEPKPLGPSDPRIDDALSRAVVTRTKDGVYRAETPAADVYWSEGRTRAEALSEMREDLRYLICDPVYVNFYAYSRLYVAEARPAREGGFWAVVPALGGCSTCGDTMDELKYMLIDLAKGYIEEA